MSFEIHELEKAFAVARSVTVRGDQRCFGRLSSASNLREITPRTAQALLLAQRAAPHLQRHVILTRRLFNDQSVNPGGGRGSVKIASKMALAAIQGGLRQEIEAMQEDLRLNPPSEVEQEFLESAAFGTYPKIPDGTR
jgi:hypothetical protein